MTLVEIEQELSDLASAAQTIVLRLEALQRHVVQLQVEARIAGERVKRRSDG